MKNNIKYYRMLNCKKISEMCELLNCSKHFYNLIEDCLVETPFEYIRKISEYLKVDIVNLFGEIEKEEMIFKLPEIEELKTYNIADIISIVAEEEKVQITDIMSKNRNGNISDARQISMYLIRKFTNMSFPQIGKFFKRDSSTVIQNCTAVENKLKYGKPEYSFRVTAIIERLEQL